MAITDPPYHLASIAKRFGRPGSAPAQPGRDGAANRLSRGFMGSETDAGDISFHADTWRLVLDVLEPGGRLACFGGTRTWWRTAAAIDAAGFEIEDTIMWVYGQGLVLRSLEAQAVFRARNFSAQARTSAGPEHQRLSSPPSYNTLAIFRKNENSQERHRYDITWWHKFDSSKTWTT